MNNKNSLRSVLKNSPIFIGRSDEILHFTRNLTSNEHKAIYSIYGQAGIGKTGLLNQFRKISESNLAICAWTDHSQTDVISTMVEIADQFEKSGFEMAEFKKRHKTFTQRQNELEKEPLPEKFASLIGQTLVYSGFAFANHFSGSGVLPVGDQHSLSIQIGEFTKYLYTRFKDDTPLLQNPTLVLSKAFVESLQKVMEKNMVVIFFDKHEKTERYIDQWLLNLLHLQYGELFYNFILVIAGQNQIDFKFSAEFETIIYEKRLKPLSKVESRKFLESKGVIGEELLTQMIQVSKGVPMHLFLQAEKRPNTLAEVESFNDALVDFILKDIDEETKIRLVKFACIPRQINLDIINILVQEDEDQVEEYFIWLKSQAFIEKAKFGWSYHDSVRLPLLRFSRQRSPMEWMSIHTEIAKYYMLLQKEHSQNSALWQSYEVEVIYHLLSCKPDEYLDIVLTKVIDSILNLDDMVLLLISVLDQVGDDLNSQEIKNWAKVIKSIISSLGESDYQNAIKMINTIFARDNFKHNSTNILTLRARLYASNEKLDFAISDLSEVLTKDTSNFDLYLERSWLYFKSENHELALRDIDFALKLNADSSESWGRKGVYELASKKFKNALNDFNRAIQLSAGDTGQLIHWMGHRGETYLSLKQHTNALIDFNAVLTLDPKNLFVLGALGDTFLHLKNYNEALGCFSKIIEITGNKQNEDYDPRYHHLALLGNAKAYLDMGKLDNSIDCCKEAILIESRDASAWVQLFTALEAFCPEQLIEHVKSLQVSFSPDGSSYAARGEAFFTFNYFKEAIVDFTNAILADPRKQHHGKRRIGDAYISLGNYEEAIAHYKQALEIEPYCEGCLNLFIDAAIKLYTIAEVKEMVISITGIKDFEMHVMDSDV